MECQMESVTFRIKKVWFDEIAFGTKVTEYRKASSYNSKLIKKKPKYVRFHYQGKRKIEAKIARIRTIKIDGVKHYAIDLDFVSVCES